MGCLFLRLSSWPRDWTYISCIGGWLLYYLATWEAPHMYLPINEWYFNLKQKQCFQGFSWFICLNSTPQLLTLSHTLIIALLHNFPFMATSVSALYHVKLQSLPGGSDSKESIHNAGDLCLIPGFGMLPGGGHGNPLQYSCLENPHGQRSLAGYSPRCRKESDMTDWLGTTYLRYIYIYIYIYNIFKYIYNI